MRTNPNLKRAQGSVVKSVTPVTTGQLSLIFWLILSYFIFLGVHAFIEYDLETVIGYFLVMGSSMAPIKIWIDSRFSGMPIYPLCSGFAFITFGAPLITQHPGIISYTQEDRFAAACIITGGLLAGTVAWYLSTKRQIVVDKKCLQLTPQSGERLLLACMFLYFLFWVNLMFHYVNIGGGTYSIVQGSLIGLNSLSVFILSQRFGNKVLRKPYLITFLVLLGMQSCLVTTGLYLTNTFSALTLCIAGYTLGSKRIPWIATVSLLLVAGFLHAGKSEMRRAYWGEDKTTAILSFIDIVPFYFNWFDASTTEIFNFESKDEDSEHSASLMQRGSLVQLLLYMRECNLKQNTPYLNGETYILLPVLLIPRIIYPDKPWTQESNNLLNIHYGLQTREETLTTTIGFGMFNEGYGNFGPIGVIGAGAFLGFFFGSISHWASGYPVLSFRTLFSILALCLAFQTEFTSGTFVTSFFQSLVALTVFSYIFMRPSPVEEETILVQNAPLRRKNVKPDPAPWKKHPVNHPHP